MTGLLAPLKEKNGSPLALAAALMVGFGVWRLSETIVAGALGWLFLKLNLSNDDRSFSFALGSILHMAVVVALAWFTMLFLLKGASPVGDIKDAVAKARDEKPPEEKKEEAAPPGGEKGAE